MSWLSENYDKAALGAAAAVALAVGYSVFSGGNEVVAPKVAIPNNTVEIEQRKTLSLAHEKFSGEYAFEPKQIDGIEVQSFVSFPLYSIKGKPGVQPLTDDYEIHPGMRLGWWKQYDFQDYSKSDGPELDADKDGFNNREEFDGKTDPTDAKSHPDFIAKLKCDGVKGLPYSMNWTDLDGKKANFTFKFEGRSSITTTGVGKTFPKRCRNKSLIARFEILKRAQDPDIPGENGQYYLLQDNGKLQGKKKLKLYYRQRKELEDWTGSFSLDIEGSSAPFPVPEGGSFSLPYDEKAKLMPYKFKSKKGNLAEIEYDMKGKKSSIELDIPPTKKASR